MSRLWVSPYNDKERQTIHDDPKQCAHKDDVCAECCTCNPHSGCPCADPPCECPWKLPVGPQQALLTEDDAAMRAPGAYGIKEAKE